MSVEAILGGLMLLGALSLALAWPWLRAERPAHGSAAIHRPQDEYQSVVAAIRDLDFDHLAGVVGDEDYSRRRQALTVQGVALIEETDRQTAAAVELERRIEVAVGARRARKKAKPPERQRSRGAGRDTARSPTITTGELEEEIERAVQASRRSGRGVAGGAGAQPIRSTCAACAEQVRKHDQFCRSCGNPLTGVCANCGRVADPNDRFCTGCGLALGEEVSFAT